MKNFQYERMQEAKQAGCKGCTYWCRAPVTYSQPEEPGGIPKANVPTDGECRKAYPITGGSFPKTEQTTWCGDWTTAEPWDDEEED